MFQAAAWLDEWLAAYPWRALADADADAARLALVHEAGALPKSSRVALHKEAVGRLPALRAPSDDPFRWHKGSALYELACRLYEAKLPYAEEDVCALLASSKHACGHGADVKPPFETAVQWARANRITPAWLAAVRTFIEGLRGLTSVKAQDLKTKGALVLVLDGTRGPSIRCQVSERFRSDLARFEPVERAAWERLVLHMGTAMSARPQKGYDDQAAAFVAFLCADQVLARLDGWVPAPGGDGPCKLETAGSHLLKNMVWLLLVMASDAAVAPSCDALVERLARAEYKPAQLGKKIALACAVYFAQRPTEIGLQPLEALLARTAAMEKGTFDSDRIRKIVESYRSKHADRAAT